MRPQIDAALDYLASRRWPRGRAGRRWSYGALVSALMMARWAWPDLRAERDRGAPRGPAALAVAALTACFGQGHPCVLSLHVQQDVLAASMECLGG